MQTKPKKWLLVATATAILSLTLLTLGFTDAIATIDIKPPPIINNYSSNITVQSDSLLLVTEKINITTDGTTIQHGIYRDFPVVYKTKDGRSVLVSFNIKNALLDGQPVAYRAPQLRNGIRVYLGDSKRYLPAGTYTFTLTYTTLGQLGFFADHDELYWNVTGNGWDYSISNAQATVKLPPDAAKSITDTTAYTGSSGSRAQDYRVTRNAEHEIIFTTTTPLEPRQGLTIVVGWPKGFVTPPNLKQQLAQYPTDIKVYAILGMGLLAVLLYYLLVWSMYGRDPESGAIIPEYAPPEGFAPAALRYILAMGYDDKVFTAAILNLAVKGFLTITENEDKKYTLTKNATFSGQLSSSEKVIADKIFHGRDTLEIKQQAFIANTVKTYKEELKKEFATTYFVKNQKYVIIGIVLSALTVGLTYVVNLSLLPTLFIMAIFGVFTFSIAQRQGSISVVGYRSVANFLRSIIFIVSMIFMTFVFIQIIKELPLLFPWLYIAAYFSFIAINLLFGYLMKRPTLLGKHLIAHIKGFKLFLEATEKDRLNFRNPPQLTPRLFEQYLPYALALGVEQKWSEQFSDVLTQANYQPTWYHGVYGGFHADSFSGSIGSSFASAISSASTPPGSSSGFGGGGGAGGGGGGGGGGGW